MIEENVRDYARVVAVLRNQHAAECGHRGMRIGEGIDTAVMADSLGDSRRHIIADASFHEIAGKIADQRLGVLFRQQQVRQVVHGITIPACAD